MLQNKVRALNDQIDGVKPKMTEIVEQILDRVEKLDNLVMKSKETEEGVSLAARTYPLNFVRFSHQCIFGVLCKIKMLLNYDFSIHHHHKPIQQVSRGHPTFKTLQNTPSLSLALT